MPWEQLRAIQEENRQINKEAKSQPPTTCPIDGQPLDVRGNIRNCPFGNFRWPTFQ